MVERLPRDQIAERYTNEYTRCTVSAAVSLFCPLLKTQVRYGKGRGEPYRGIETDRKTVKEKRRCVRAVTLFSIDLVL